MPTANDVINVALRRAGVARVRDWAVDKSVEANVARDLFHEARKDILGLHYWNRATRRTKLAELTSAPAYGWDNAFRLPHDFISVVSVHPADAEYSSIPYKLEFINDESTAGSLTVIDYTALGTDTYRFTGINIVDTTLTAATDFTAETNNNTTATNIGAAIGTTSTTGIVGLTASVASAVVTVTSASGYTLQKMILSDAVNVTVIQPTFTSQYALFSNSDTIFLRYIFDLDNMDVWSATMRDVLAMRLARDFAMALAQDRILAEKLEVLYQRKLSRIKARDGVEDWPEQRPTGSWVSSRLGGQEFTINDG